jgi:hypothetical protein
LRRPVSIASELATIPSKPQYFFKFADLVGERVGVNPQI